MAEAVTKICPRCGKRPLDLRLEQCPYCGVPFELVPTTLTEEQLRAMTRFVLRSGRFWSVIGTVVILLAAGLISLIYFESGKVSKDVSNQISTSADRVSQRVADEIAAEFQQPRIQETIQQIAAQRAADAISNGVWASLESFRAEVQEARSQLAETRGAITGMSNDIETARIAASHLLAAVSNDPPYLQLIEAVTNFNGSNYVLSLAFKTSNANPVGAVELAAGTMLHSANIVNFTASNVDHVDSPTISDGGDAADLKFTTGQVQSPIVLTLELSDATIVRIVGDALEQTLTIPVHPELMRLPSRANR